MLRRRQAIEESFANNTENTGIIDNCPSISYKTSESEREEGLAESEATEVD